MVHIRSKDCYDETDSSSQLTPGFNTHLQVTLNSVIERIPGHRFHISLSSAEIPFTWYNVSAHLKSRQIELSSGTSLNLDEANYNIYELVAAITAAAFPYSATYDIKTNKVTLTNTDSTTRFINFASNDSKELSKMLGFDRLNREVTSGAFISSDGAVNLRPVHSMFLYSNLAASNVLTTTYGGNIENILDKIPLGNVDPLQVIAYDYYETAPFSTIITTDAVQSFEVSLRDQNGKLIQLNNARYELSLLIEQRLSYELEMDHPAHPYPAITRRKGEDKEEVDKKDKEEEPKKPPLTPSPPTIAPPLAPRPQPLGGSTIPILSSTPAAPTPVPTIKRPRIDEEQLQRQEMELDQAIMLAGIL
ncbi:MAG: hypothetical protein CML57_11060 [Rhodobacteraceae bacterium]|nr:hypothetical protein [Paracoccaceae bacterium]|tara:strand:- start:1017 stop:2102 length:1086 start_codon:yes stop_codon:yes gene_type:complete